MATVYCPKCFARTDDQAARCPACRRRNPGHPAQMAFGGLVVAGLAGAVVTAIYARLLYMVWPRWQRLFDGDHPDPAGYADEAAILIGVVVFVASALLTAACLFPREVRVHNAR